MPELWAHQKNALELGKKEPDLALLFDMGTGKTRTALEILRFRMNENKRILRTLIIGPTGVLFNWRNEIAKYTKIPLDKVFVLNGAINDRMKMIQVLPKDSIFITNYEAFATAKFAEVFAFNPPEFLILDESHRVKSHTALRTKALMRLSDNMKNMPVSYRMLLTGTPVLNNELDLFTQYRILDGGKRLGTNFFQFRSRYFEDKNKYIRQLNFPKWVAKANSRDELKRQISSISLHAAKEDCLDLPPLVRVSFPVTMSKDQAEAYKSMKNDFLSVCKEGVAIAQLAITKALRMQQILSGFLKLDDGSIHRFEKNPRADALEELLEDLTEKHKVIVWSVFHEDYQTIENRVKKLGLKYSTVTGLTTDKQKEIDAFQTDESVRVMIASQAAGGVGINLTAASYMIYYSRGYSLEHDLQSEARAYRGGSEIHKSITRLDLVAEDTIDVAVLDALKNKKDLSKDILSLAKFC